MVLNEKGSFETDFLMEAFCLNRVFWLLTRRYSHGFIFCRNVKKSIYISIVMLKELLVCSIVHCQWLLNISNLRIVNFINVNYKNAFSAMWHVSCNAVSFWYKTFIIISNNIYYSIIFDVPPMEFVGFLSRVCLITRLSTGICYERGKFIHSVSCS